MSVAVQYLVNELRIGIFECEQCERAGASERTMHVPWLSVHQGESCTRYVPFCQIWNVKQDEHKMTTGKGKKVKKEETKQQTLNSILVKMFLKCRF